METPFPQRHDTEARYHRTRRWPTVSLEEPRLVQSSFSSAALKAVGGSAGPSNQLKHEPAAGYTQQTGL